jgi:hypothetical protein
MSFNLERSFQEKFQEYKKLILIGEYYAAVSRLVQIFHCLNDADQEVRDKWVKQLRSERLPDAALHAIKAEISKDVEYIKHVLSIGEEWNDDEILLVLQQRIFVDLFEDFLRQLYGIDLQLSVEQVDNMIESTAKTKQNKWAFESAIRLMRRNWGLPIKSKWLSDDLTRS